MNDGLTRWITPSPNILKKKKSLLVVTNLAPEWGGAGVHLGAGVGWGILSCGAEGAHGRGC